MRISDQESRLCSLFTINQCAFMMYANKSQTLFFCVYINQSTGKFMVGGKIGTWTIFALKVKNNAPRRGGMLQSLSLTCANLGVENRQSLHDTYYTCKVMGCDDMMQSLSFTCAKLGVENHPSLHDTCNTCKTTGCYGMLQFLSCRMQS
jgi:hypothetical protein